MILIRLAVKREINEILKVTAACNLFMRANGIFQWTENYPSKKAFETDILRNELYVLTKDAEIIGCITVSSVIDDEYKPVKWLTKTSKHKYVHRLAVHPNYQGKGYAKKLMDFAEALAKEDSCISVRLDTFGKNRRNQKFYEARGYQRLEPIFFPAQSEHPFYCYELILEY
jgi:ribosomal protein S18 acetylase RimI-like enzyme